MMRSLFSGLTGMRAQQLQMDVIGSNIANVNTAGYKASRVTFEDLLYQSLRAETEVVNAVQVGSGVRAGTIDTLFGQGSPQPTGNGLDLAISGEGFLVLNQQGSRVYTRAGGLSFDKQGYLIQKPSGNRVMGWKADSTGQVQPGLALQELRVEPGTRAQATASTGVWFTGLLDARLPVGSTVVRDIKVIDELGRDHILTISFTRDDATNWSWDIPAPGGGASLGSGVITFSAGRVTAATAVSGPITWDLADGITPPMQFTLDFSGCELGGGETTVAGTQIGGVAAGSLEDVAFDESGQMIGIYSNGTRQVLGQLALAIFTNPGGLERSAQNLFLESGASGTADTRTVPGVGRGKFNLGSLEMSNVDLTQEFAAMILSQRAFQANSRIITTTDELLQEVVNLRR